MMFISEKHEKIFQRVLKEIKPTEEERRKQLEVAEKIVKRLDELTPKDVKIELTGSTAKGTNLRGDMDFDVFMLFSKDYSLKDVLSLGLKYAKKFCGKNKYEIAYAQHPYLRTWVDGVEVDIVPSYKIDDISEMTTAVDRTPLHTKYVNRKITDKQRDEVRLLKKFLKTQKIYGAEGRIRGFSGYLCELLILKYGGILELFDAATRWRDQQVIILDEEPSESKVKELKNKFKDAALIVIDPVDPERNVAASVSKTSLSVFIYSAEMFLNKPSISAFLPSQEKINKKWIEKQLKLRDSLIIGLEFKRPDVVEDILWPQLYRFAEKIKSKMEENDFKVFDIDIYANGKCMLLCEFSVYSLPRILKIYGPPLSQKENVQRFIRQHNVTEPIWFENERILAVGERKYTHVNEIIKEILKKPKENGVPPDVLKVIKTAKIINADKIKRNYTQFLFEYLKKRNVP
jgi:tRNA nucleotidyltransferase (CCA-adding enzyme)